MSDYLERDYHRVAGPDAPTHFLTGTSIEIVHPLSLSRPPKHALFDFDGTLSLIREGWAEIMVPMMTEVLLGTGTSETREQLARLSRDFVMELNGKQTIYQMIRLAEEVTLRGGRPKDPLEYKQTYHDRLMARISARREALRSGAASPEEMLVPGAFEILKALQERDVRLYLASGTDVNYVREETALLKLDPFFGRHVYGAVDDYKSFSKAKVIESILEQNCVPGDLLIGFGDGYVEIQNIKAVGGTAVAVASDEAGRSGRADPWKRDRLMGVGADIVIPDFRESSALTDYLWGRNETSA